LPQAKRLKTLEAESAKLKRPPAEQMLDKAAMKKVLSKGRQSPPRSARLSRTLRPCSGVPDCRGGPEDGAMQVAARA
jgi:hypothetical protein